MKRKLRITYVSSPTVVCLTKESQGTMYYRGQ